MYIAVVGAGAMGCLYGAFLKKNGYDVVLVDVWKEHMDKINAEGLKIQIDNDMMTVPIPAKRANEVEGKPDLVIMFTKTLHREKAIEDARQFIGDQTVVLTLQNGIGNVEAIEKVVPRERIIVGVTDFPSDLIGPGQIKSKGKGHTKIMSADGRITAPLENIMEALDKAGFNCEISSDVFIAIWQKLAFNAALNSITAVTRLTVGGIGAIHASAELAELVVAEVIAVANAKGIAASKDQVMAMVSNAFAHHVNHIPSMLQDVIAKRQTEIEAINGSVVREASNLGIAVPVTQILYHLVRTVEQAYDQQILTK